MSARDLDDIAADNEIDNLDTLNDDSVLYVGQGNTPRTDAAAKWGTLKAWLSGVFATAAQGDLADTAVQPEDLGDAALLDVGTTEGTVAAGDDSRITGAAQAASLATVATSGEYDDLTGKPPLDTAAFQPVEAFDAAGAAVAAQAAAIAAAETYTDGAVLNTAIDVYYNSTSERWEMNDGEEPPSDGSRPLHFHRFDNPTPTGFNQDKDVWLPW